MFTFIVIYSALFSASIFIIAIYYFCSFFVTVNAKTTAINELYLTLSARRIFH